MSPSGDMLQQLVCLFAQNIFHRVDAEALFARSRFLVLRHGPPAAPFATFR